MKSWLSFWVVCFLWGGWLSGDRAAPRTLQSGKKSPVSLRTSRPKGPVFIHVHDSDISKPHKPETDSSYKSDLDSSYRDPGAQAGRATTFTLSQFLEEGVGEGAVKSRTEQGSIV